MINLMFLSGPIMSQNIPCVSFISKLKKSPGCFSSQAVFAQFKRFLALTQQNCLLLSQEDGTSQCQESTRDAKALILWTVFTDAWPFKA